MDDLMVGVVGVRGFEPPASTSRTWRSTRLSYTPSRAVADNGLPKEVDDYSPRIQRCVESVGTLRAPVKRRSQ
ncbi:MAG: hypothetical protein RLZZ123_2785 [Pseudomonadota bacterium]